MINSNLIREHFLIVKKRRKVMKIKKKMCKRDLSRLSLKINCQRISYPVKFVFFLELDLTLFQNKLTHEIFYLNNYL